MQNIEDVYKEYSNTVYKYLFCLTNNHDISEELTQETFAIAVKEISKFKGECKISVWLCQIGKHLWYKELKKRDKTVEIDEIKDFQDLETIDDIIIKKENKLNLYKDIQKLDEKSKELIYLRMIGNLNFIEIAEILGKTPNWVRVNFHRAKQKMREVNKDGKENRM